MQKETESPVKGGELYKRKSARVFDDANLEDDDEDLDISHNLNAKTYTKDNNNMFKMSAISPNKPSDQGLIAL
jgi:hypothetical protein